MPTIRLLKLAALRSPRLLATAFICLTIGANTHATGANTLPHSLGVIALSDIKSHADSDGSDNAGLIKAVMPLAASAPAKNMQLLSPKDADLYRAAFAAQAEGDWPAADMALSEVKDRKLLGHVLADRYQRRAPNQAELQEWLASYSDLPEAPAFYDKASHMAAIQGGKMTLPSVAANWNGSETGSSAYGFKSDVQKSAEARHIEAKIDRALRRGEPQEAKALLDAEGVRDVLSPEEHADIASRIAANLFYDSETSDARLVADQALFGRNPSNQNPLALWIAGLAAWKEKDIAAAGKFFTRLAALNDLDSWDRAAVDFWAYRAAKQQGDRTLARYWLEQTAKQPKSFYGLLAVSLLGSAEAKSWQMPVLNDQNIAALSSRPPGWRALALIQIGQTQMAESELHHLNPLSNRDLQEAMLAIAEQNHMPTLAMKLGGIAVNMQGQRFEAALYPVPPWQPDHGFQVDRALIYALMRHESGFNPVAMSDRGACGLMQLMPATASRIADDNKTVSTCSGRLLNPSYNMALGQKYVRLLASQPSIGDNLLLILAAYNGGPGNLAHWTDDEATRKDPLLFIESLPVHETRDYVQQVMIHYWNYCSRLSEPQTTLTQLARGEWPRANLRDVAPAASRTKQMRVMNDGIKLASD